MLHCYIITLALRGSKNAEDILNTSPPVCANLKPEALIKWPSALSWRTARRAALLALLILFALMINDAARINLDGPPPSYLLLDRHGAFIAELADEGQDYGYWPVSTVPPRVVAAALALEDKRFYSHPGVDPVAIGRALYQNMTHKKRVSGASTIAMQVARLLDPGKRNYLNKLIESWRALVLTARYGRNEILAAYLRLVPYGNRIHGIAYAARRYLDKPVEDLSWAEIAYLSAIPQAPGNMNPFHENGRQRAIERGSRLLRQLQKSGVLTPAEEELALHQIREFSFSGLDMRSEQNLHAIFKIRQLLKESPPHKTYEPYRITTTLDLELQRSVTELASEAVDEWKSQGVGNAAVILLDRKSNAVLAWVGSTDYFDKKQSGAIDYALTQRSPGSTLKPFIYALGFEQGKLTPATILDDLPSEGYGIVNADRAYQGPLLPRQALANSRNIPAVHLLREIGLDEGYAFLRDLGLHHDEQDAQHYGLGLAIGAMPVTLEVLVQAYSVLANDGKFRSLNWFAGQSGTSRQLISPGTARQVTLQLSDPAARLPSFPRMGTTEYAFPVALKTGSSEGLRDAWTIAYSQRYLIGVWIGNPDARPMHKVTGAGNAAELTQRILNKLHGNEQLGQADLSFPPPEGYRKATLCALTGKRATNACDTTFEEWFRPGQEPVQDDHSHIRLAVDLRNGMLAQAATPRRYVEQRTFINLPPRYANWATQAGLPHPPQEVSTLGEVMDKPLRAHFSEHLTSFSKPILRVIAPGDGLTLLRDPSIPDSRSTIGLRVEISPPIREVLWLIDGKPYQLAAYPYTVRWPLKAGEHVIQARSPFSSEISAPVRVHVQ